MAFKDWPETAVKEVGPCIHMHDIHLRLINFSDLEPDEERVVVLPKTPKVQTARQRPCLQRLPGHPVAVFRGQKVWRTTGRMQRLSDWKMLAEAYALGNALDHAAFADAVIDAAWRFAGHDQASHNFEQFAAEVY